MRFFFLFFFLIISNLSYSYENNQLLLHKEFKKIEKLKLKSLNGEKFFIFEKKNESKLYFLNFWATWCTPCLKEIPDLIKLEKKFKNKIKIFFISVDANPKKVVPKFLKKNNFENLPIYNDEKLNIAKKLNVKVMPTTLVINKDIKEISRVEGYINWLDRNMLKQIKSLL
ncbi:MAG: TlpA disulfide reductase family protein [Pseudomonadota bacterium]|nr:TlpA disulfide reductase family protein [Pseudomonadota bacterium]